MSHARVYGTSRSITLLRSGFFDAYIDANERRVASLPRSAYCVAPATAREIVRNSVLRERQMIRYQHHFHKPFVKRVQRECYLLAALPVEQEVLL